MQSQQYPNLPPVETLWSTLGGGPLKGNGDEKRGQAFWRDGDGWSIAVNVADGAWFDHVSGEGGGEIRLVEVVLNCDRRDALAWLRDHFGLSLAPTFRAPADTGWAADLRRALWWSICAEAMGEAVLESLPCWHPERIVHTDLLAAFRSGDAAIVDEFRAWRRREPTLTAALVEVGRRRDARLQRKLAIWLRRHL